MFYLVLIVSLSLTYFLIYSRFMLAKILSATLQGIDTLTVEIEVNASERGVAQYISIVGLPDTAIRESKERVCSALDACGIRLPRGRSTINLAPADVKKEGASFDLPIAVGMAVASQKSRSYNVLNTLIVGELALDGSVRPINGVLPIAIHAKQHGISALIVPEMNADEAAILDGIKVIGIKNLHDTLAFLENLLEIQPRSVDMQAYYQQYNAVKPLDYHDIKGQEFAKRAMEVAAAGGHNGLLIGPPGSGKSMLAQRLPSIMPFLSLDAAIESGKIHSVMGKLDKRRPLLIEAPFRHPHHSISDAGLLGGKSPPIPGEISLAHNGILFLDELPEFKRHVLEMLRQPMETREVTIARAAGSYTFPANVQLIAAMNPCPCGYYGSTQRECRCRPQQIQRYRARISGPLLDRIDLHVEIFPLHEEELIARPKGELSTTIRRRVEQARSIQQQRFQGLQVPCNANMGPPEMKIHCRLDGKSERLLRSAIRELNLSARAYDRILRVARTLADLEAVEDISNSHIAEAIQYRSLDRQLW